MGKWLIRKCAESGTFAWGVTFIGFMLMILIMWGGN